MHGGICPFVENNNYFYQQTHLFASGNSYHLYDKKESSKSQKKKTKKNTNPNHY